VLLWATAAGATSKTLAATRSAHSLPLRWGVGEAEGERISWGVSMACCFSWVRRLESEPQRLTRRLRDTTAKKKNKRLIPMTSGPFAEVTANPSLTTPKARSPE
jgi:hypothetical protein